MKLWKVIAILSTVIAFLMIGISLFYLYLYFNEIYNPYGNEFIGVFYASFIYSVPFWILASVSISKIEERLARSNYLLVYIMTAIVSLLSLGLIVMAIFQGEL